MKNIFDKISALFGLSLLAHFFIIIAIIIKLDSKGPVFFRQERVGKGGHIFRIYKFRTMAAVQESGSSKITVGNDKRITKIGAVLRKYKIDELPQLINVLLGQMSIVGPRPEVAEYVAHYRERDKKIVFSIKPGITDLASIKFRNESEILAAEKNPHEAYIKKILPRKIKYYLFYARKNNICMDIWIIYRTILAVVR